MAIFEPPKWVVKRCKIFTFDWFEKDFQIILFEKIDLFENKMHV